MDRPLDIQRQRQRDGRFAERTPSSAFIDSQLCDVALSVRLEGRGPACEGLGPETITILSGPLLVWWEARRGAGRDTASVS